MRRSEFRLGSHTIRPAVDEIGTERIESKAMEVLLTLVNAAPDPVTPKELLELRRKWSTMLFTKRLRASGVRLAMMRKTLSTLRQFHGGAIV